MSRFFAQMNRSFTAHCGERFGACAAFLLLIIAGIAGAVSVLFIARRLDIPVAVGCGLLLVSAVPVFFDLPRRKSTARS